MENMKAYESEYKTQCWAFFVISETTFFHEDSD